MHFQLTNSSLLQLEVRRGNRKQQAMDLSATVRGKICLLFAVCCLLFVVSAVCVSEEHLRSLSHTLSGYVFRNKLFLVFSCMEINEDLDPDPDPRTSILDCQQLL
jgi:hypothetical protein